ncbi:MAG: cytochrome C oxidase subunit IV family protein [Phycisphaerales bacterium]|nr:cytochrome C oxidase subunit IV family protein [Phycisphaerales bacterium]
MDAAHHVDIKAHLRKYYIVFAALAVGTILTVAASQIDATPTQHVLIALFIAICKASLVGAYFMHLISERKALFSILILTVVLFGVLMSLPTMTHDEMAGHPQIQMHLTAAPLTGEAAHGGTATGGAHGAAATDGAHGGGH